MIPKIVGLNYANYSDILMEVYIYDVYEICSC